MAYPFSEAARGSHRLKEGRRRILHAMFLESYFDDSSDPERKEFRACGGLIGGPDQWDAFEVLWSRATSDLKEPFRSADCEGGHGQFRRWSKTSRDALMAELVTVLCAANLMGFAGIVPVAEYRRAFPTCRQHDSYFLALRQVLMNVAHISYLLGRDAKVWFERDSHAGEALRIFGRVTSFKSWPPSNSLGGIYFDTKKLRPLQAADLVAREAFKHIKNLGNRPTRQPVRRMQGSLCFMLWTEKTLVHLAANGGADNLKVLAEWQEERAPTLQHYEWPQK